jgi:aminopeptidase
VTDPRVDRMARLLVERMLAVGPGQTLLVECEPLAEPLLERVVRGAAARDAHVVVVSASERVRRALLEASSPATLAREHRAHTALMETVDAILRIECATSTRPNAGLAADRYPAYLRGRAPGNAVRQQRTLAGAFRWAVGLHPCAAFAAEAGLALADYEDLVYRAAKCDREDPEAAWDRQGAEQARLIELFEAGSELRILAPGTDIAMRIDGRRWRNSCAARNLPDGEVFTGPIEDSVAGVVEFTYPAIHGGQLVEGIRLVFERGEVVEATARTGQDVLDEALATDAGSRRLGEVGIGTNYGLERFTTSTLLDEKIGGTIHLALGSGYPETGSVNRSAEHWDLVCDLRAGGEIVLDGRTIQRDGRFVRELGIDL